MLAWPTAWAAVLAVPIYLRNKRKRQHPAETSATAVPQPAEPPPLRMTAEPQLLVTCSMPSPMTNPQSTTPSTEPQPGARPTDFGVTQQSRERRYQRALAGWLATRTRNSAHQRRRMSQQAPPHG